LKEVDEWPLVQVLNGERDTLGHYLSGHPFDPYREEMRTLVGHDLGDLERIWEGRPESARSGWRPELELVIAGLVTGLRKKGDSQMFVQIEDGRGRLECAFFAETYNEFAQLIARDRLLIVQGGLREDAFSGGFALKAQRCWDYSQLCAKHVQRLSLRLDLRVPGTWTRVDSLLARHRPGPTPLRLDLLRRGPARRIAFAAGRADGEAGVLKTLVNRLFAPFAEGGSGICSARRYAPQLPPSLPLSEGGEHRTVHALLSAANWIASAPCIPLPAIPSRNKHPRTAPSAHLG
jgi:DNA polymerase-3 subunit alpha